MKGFAGWWTRVSGCQCVNPMKRCVDFGRKMSLAWFSSRALCILLIPVGAAARCGAEETQPLDVAQITVYEAPGPNVTDQLVNLGSPLDARYADVDHRYARNVWCMEVFDGKLFFGHGNSSNMPPASNAGQINAGGNAGVDIWCYDPSTARFQCEGRISEEQIERFRIVDGVLTIPGHDSTKPSWEYGSYYQRRADGSWKSYNDVPNGVHVYDIAQHGASLFAALGSDGKHAAIAVKRPSQESESRWTHTLAPERLPAKNALRVTRAYGFFTIKDRLFACGTPILVLPPDLQYFGNILAWRDENWTIDKEPQRLLVGLGKTYVTLVRIERAVSFKDATAYLCVRNWNDHQWKPLSLAWATGLESNDIHQVPLASDDVPYDIKPLGGDQLAVLVNRLLPSGQYRVSMLTTTDLYRWTERFHFTAETFARSFANLNGDFYFGLGSELEAEVVKGAVADSASLSSATGQILRLRTSP